MTYDPETDNRPRCPITGPGYYEQADGREARIEACVEQGSRSWKGVDANGWVAYWFGDGWWSIDGKRSGRDLIRYLRPPGTEQPDSDALKALSDADLDAAEASAVEAARAPFEAERERREVEREAWTAFIPEAREFAAAEWEAYGRTDMAADFRAAKLDHHSAVRAIARALASKATAQ